MLESYLSILETESERSEFEKLYLAYRDEMFFIAHMFLRNVHDAEDAVHEAFLRAANNASQVLGLARKKQRVFLCSLVRSISSDMHDSNERHKGSGQGMTAVPDDEGTLDERLIRKGDHEALIGFIMNMSSGLKDAMYMKYVAGLSNPEIAAALDISENTLRQRLYTGRRLIKEYIEERSSKGEA